jgi:hypothetical protein
LGFLPLFLAGRFYIIYLNNMSPQATKNIRVIGYFLLGIALVLTIFIPITYYTEKDHFENSKTVNSEIIEYTSSSHTKGGATITQFVRVRFTNPDTNETKIVTTTLTAVNTLDSDNRVAMEKKKSLLPIGTVTTSFYHPASDQITIASELPNGELVKPGATIPLLVKLLVPFAAVGALVLTVGMRKHT